EAGDPRQFLVPFRCVPPTPLSLVPRTRRAGTSLPERRRAHEKSRRPLTPNGRPTRRSCHEYQRGRAAGRLSISRRVFFPAASGGQRIPRLGAAVPGSANLPLSPRLQGGCQVGAVRAISDAESFRTAP